MPLKFCNKRIVKKSLNIKRRLTVESLENRQLLTTLVVDSLSDVNDGDFSSGNFTLREAISVANLLAGEETITFDTDGVFATPQRIEMSGTELEISESLTIDGTGADSLTIDANGASRVVNITASDGEIALQGLTLTGGNVVGFGSVNRGGAIRIEAGALTVANSVITGNDAQSYGGGIYAQSTASLTVIRSTVSGNNGSWGGGILAYGQTTIESSTISGNSSMSGGGGMYVANTHIINSTISNNVAGSGGGGIDVDGGVSVTMENSIVAGNSDSSGFADLRVRYGSTVAASYSLIGDASSAVITGSGNIIGDSTAGGTIDAMLAPLGDYGGPFLTHALLPGSPALNAADPAIIFDDTSYDQRGSMFFRVQEGRMDMGAHEDLPVELRVDNNDDVFDGIVSAGNVSLREAVELANLDPGANTISFDIGGAFAGPTQNRSFGWRARHFRIHLFRRTRSQPIDNRRGWQLADSQRDCSGWRLSSRGADADWRRRCRGSGRGHSNHRWRSTRTRQLDRQQLGH